MPPSPPHGPRQPPDGFGAASERFRELAGRSRPELDRLMRHGGAVEPAEVAGGLYRGWNVAPAAALLRVSKFFKRFHEPGAGGRARGENVLARQSPITASWRMRLGGRGMLPFVALPPGAGASAGRPRALVISYGEWPGRRPLNPVGRIVDYVVRPDAQGGGPLLGASVLDIRVRHVFLEHFLLERA